MSIAKPAVDSARKVKSLLMIATGTALLAVSCLPADARPSASGPRGPSGGVEFAPVDRLGPTLAPDEQLTPDSGWNGHAGTDAGVAGPHTGPREAQPLFGVTNPPPPPKRRHPPRIILQK